MHACRSTLEDPTVESAVKHHQAGELDKAEAIYREVLKNTPQHADALHLLGVVCQQTDRPREAIKLIKQAIVLCDTAPNFHFHLGLTLKDGGQVDEAVACYRRALELKPDFVEVLLNLGAALQDQGRLDEAIECYQRALDSGSAAPGLHLNLGAALRAKGSWEEARQHLERAIELQHAFPEARVQIGLLFQERRQLQEAMACYQQALTEHPDHAAAYRCLGKALQEQQRWDEAILCYQRALEIKPRDFDAAANLGVAFEQQEQFALAADSYRQALQLQSHGQTRLRLLTVLRHLGRLTEALQVCEELIAEEPDHALAHWTRAQILLQQGDLQQGWREYAWRWRLPGQAEPCCDGIPMWDGSSLAGKTILIHGDPALGDMLLLAPCLPAVLRQARRTVITCERPLAGLLQRTFPTLDVRLSGDVQTCDVQIPLARLPQLLEFDGDQFRSNRVPLLADPAKVADWRSSSTERQPRIGVLWRGRHKANVQPGTSRAPALEHWQSLLSITGVQFISLLDDATPEELTTLCGASGHLPSTEPTSDLDALAAKIASLDLVISVDDLLPHLAANLGKEVWLVLPYAWGWQWPLGQDSSPWYDSVRLFRPKRPSAWPQLMSRLTSQLADWLNHPSAAWDSEHRQPHPPHTALPPSQIGQSRLTMQHGSRNG